MLNRKFAALAATLLYATMIVVNALANALPINGKNTGQVSAQYETLFAPAGFTFSIWGIIYLLLAVFCIQLLVHAFSKNSTAMPSSNSVLLFSLTCVLNSAWIFAWHFEHIAISLVIMVLLLYSIGVLFLRLEKHSVQFPKAKLLYLLPISIYFGWISVATIANAAAFGVSVFSDISVFYQVLCTVGVLVIGGVLALMMVFKKKNVFFAVVILWAYGGIIAKRSTSPVIHTEIIITAYLVAAVVALTLVYFAIKRLSSVRLDRM